MKRSIIAAWFCLVSMPLAVCQTTQTTVLFVGDPAPALTGAKWLAGEPVAEFERGKVYVVDVGGDPAQLGELQTMYRDQGVIVITVEPGNPEAVKGAPYRAATVAEGTGASLLRPWMQLSTSVDERGPARLAYVIDKEGRIAYIGKQAQVPRVVGEIVEGTYDARARFGTREAQMVQMKLSKNEVDDAMAMLEKMEKEPGAAPWVVPQYFYILAAVKKDPAAAKAYAERMAAAPDADAEIIVKFVETLLGSDVSNPDLELAGRLLDRAEELAGAKTPQMKGRIEAVRFELLLKKKDIAGAGALASKMAEAADADAATLNRMALAITNSEPPTRKGLLPQAERMAKRANELSASNADYMGTYARVMAEQGNYAGAIELQEQAVALAKPSVKREFSVTLEEYRQRAGK